ncbi:MAG: DAK2 domain-containing protein [Dysosmobacter sp.]
MSKEITGALFKQMILHGAAAITAQKQAINDLNVFPVPDGDTGTNMSMTIATAVPRHCARAAPASVGQASSVTASALLQGARGNSGVILSLLFRGLSKALKGMETADAAAFAAAMQEGVAAAYKAVMKPAEGTVLTVSRLAAKRAVDTAAEGADVEATLAAAIEEGYDALAQTTDMNPVLKKAGVVDAGGKGYLLILEGMLAELRGEPMPESMEEPETHRGKGRLQRHGAGGDHLHLRHRVCGAQGHGRTSTSCPYGLTSAASATVWSSVRMTRPSRSTSIPTFPAQP